MEKKDISIKIPVIDQLVVKEGILKTEENKVTGITDVQVNHIPNDMSFNPKFGISDLAGGRGVVYKVIPLDKTYVPDMTPELKRLLSADISFDPNLGIVDFAGDEVVGCKVIHDDRVTEEDFKRFNIGRDVSYETAVAKGHVLSEADWLYVKYAYACAMTVKFGKDVVIDFTNLIVDENNWFEFGPEVK